MPRGPRDPAAEAAYQAGTRAYKAKMKELEGVAMPLDQKEAAAERARTLAKQNHVHRPNVRTHAARTVAAAGPASAGAVVAAPSAAPPAAVSGAPSVPATPGGPSGLTAPSQPAGNRSQEDDEDELISELAGTLVGVALNTPGSESEDSEGEGSVKKGVALNTPVSDSEDSEGEGSVKKGKKGKKSKKRKRSL